MAPRKWLHPGCLVTASGPAAPTISSSEWVLGERATALQRTLSAGLSAIELDARPEIDSGELQRTLDELELTVPSMCWRWEPAAELGSPDPASRLAAQHYLRGALVQADRLGADALVVIPACRETPWQHEPRQVAIERAGAAIREVIVDAPPGVLLALEALRIDESFLMNTLDEADELRCLIDDDRASLLADLYHLAALEGTLSDVVAPHAAHVCLVHFAAPDRSRVGPLTPEVQDVVEVLADAGFAGSVTLEYIVSNDGDLAEAAWWARESWRAPAGGI